MLSLNYENINYVMTQILKLSCVSFSYVSISYVLALHFDPFPPLNCSPVVITSQPLDFY